MIECCMWSEANGSVWWNSGLEKWYEFFHINVVLVLVTDFYLIFEFNYIKWVIVNADEGASWHIGG